MYRTPAQALQSANWRMGSCFTASYETPMERPHWGSTGGWYCGIWC